MYTLHVGINIKGNIVIFSFHRKALPLILQQHHRSSLKVRFEWRDSSGRSRTTLAAWLSNMHCFSLYPMGPIPTVRFWPYRPCDASYYIARVVRLSVTRVASFESNLNPLTWLSAAPNLQHRFWRKFAHLNIDLHVLCWPKKTGLLNFDFTKMLPMTSVLIAQ